MRSHEKEELPVDFLCSISNSRQLFQLLDSWTKTKIGASEIRKTLFSQFDPEVPEIVQYIE